jgi:hypothetical protein
MSEPRFEKISKGETCEIKDYGKQVCGKPAVKLYVDDFENTAVCTLHLSRRKGWPYVTMARLENPFGRFFLGDFYQVCMREGKPSRFLRRPRWVIDHIHVGRFPNLFCFSWRHWPPFIRNDNR